MVLYTPYLVLATSSGNTDGNAIYALLGAGITGSVALVAILVKHVLDMRVERARYERQLASDSVEHERGIERLRLELHEQRFNTLTTRRVEATARFLASTLDVFSQITRARHSWDRDHDDEGYRDALRAVNAAEGQVAFEELRLVAEDDVVEGATKLWMHLRGSNVSQGQSLTPLDWKKWRDKYWDVRKEVISDVRTSLICAPPYPHG